jgi:threonine dehydrogenase-like Zn-dependent dehydrogenase
MFVCRRNLSSKEQGNGKWKERERAENHKETGRNEKRRQKQQELISKTGDRVAVEPGVPCEKCWLCREGRYNLCEDVHFSGVWPYHGTLQRYKVHPAKWLHK